MLAGVEADRLHLPRIRLAICHYGLLDGAVYLVRGIADDLQTVLPRQIDRPFTMELLGLDSFDSTTDKQRFLHHLSNSV